MNLKNLFALLLLLAGFSVAAPGCGQIEVSATPTRTESGAGGAPESHAGAAGASDSGGAGGQSEGGAGGEGPSCREPDETTWSGCFQGQPCYVCADTLEKYPLYLRRHPKCSSWYACDNFVRADCSSDCPKPGAEDQCQGTPGNWRGCQGLGCWVCKELVVDYPNYFPNHPFCVSNETCNGGYAACSAACPPPGDADR